MVSSTPRSVDHTHDPLLRSWVESANAGTTDFPIQNLPFGVFRRNRRDPPRIGVAIGDFILDLRESVEAGLLRGASDETTSALVRSSLNGLLALGATPAARLRQLVSGLLASGAAPQAPLVAMHDAELLLPAEIGDYTDFYASIFHAEHVGSLFRPENPLLPNYKHVPIAYHGRCSSLSAGGTAITRPNGQRKAQGGFPEFGPTERLDYEAEIGFLVCTGNDSGQPIPIDEAESHVFGACLVNDWSARDIQAWEYQPLGPFLAKNFATSLSPWVVTLDALAPFRTPAFARSPGDPKPLAYLSSAGNDRSGGLDIFVEVFLRSHEMRRREMEPMRLSRGSFRDMYWTLAQMVAHHTSNGCNLRPGDLLASGTVSGEAPGSEGCLLELTRRGPTMLPSGEQRTFLADGDEVALRAFCERSGYVRIGFGECTGVIRPAPPAPR
jgi:fumarylacetoacetase